MKADILDFNLTWKSSSGEDKNNNKKSIDEDNEKNDKYICDNSIH